MHLRHDRIPFFLELSDSRRALRLGAAPTPRQALIGGAAVAAVAGGVRLVRAACDLLPDISLEDLDLLDAEMVRPDCARVLIR